MSIQPSLIIWTVICFCLFVIVFNGLIIKPVLRVMDSRRERAASARSRSAELEADRRRALDERALRMEEARRLAAAKQEAELARIRAEKEAELREYAEALRADAINEKEPDMLPARAEAALNARMDELLAVFGERLLSGGKK